VNTTWQSLMVRRVDLSSSLQTVLSSHRSGTGSHVRRRGAVLVATSAHRRRRRKHGGTRRRKTRSCSFIHSHRAVFQPIRSRIKPRSDLKRFEVRSVVGGRSSRHRLSVQIDTPIDHSSLTFDVRLQLIRSGQRMMNAS